MAETSIEGNDAAAEQYREFTIESGARGPTAHWFRIQRAGQDEFRFTLYLTPLQIRGVKSEGLSDDAEKVGRGTVHGLIDLARYQRGRSYREIRAPEWNTKQRESDVSDLDLRIELLAALDRLRSAPVSEEDRGLDLEGIAGVIGVSVGRLNFTLATLDAEELVKGAPEAGAESTSTARAAITDRGVNFLEQHRAGGS